MLELVSDATNHFNDHEYERRVTWRYKNVLFQEWEVHLDRSKSKQVNLIPDDPKTTPGAMIYPMEDGTLRMGLTFDRLYVTEKNMDVLIQNLQHVKDGFEEYKKVSTI